jgi:hypothetical protein
MQDLIGADEGHSVDAVVGVLSSAVDEIIPPGLADETFAVLQVISLKKCVTFKSSGWTKGAAVSLWISGA